MSSAPLRLAEAARKRARGWHDWGTCVTGVAGIVGMFAFAVGAASPVGWIVGGICVGAILFVGIETTRADKFAGASKGQIFMDELSTAIGTLGALCGAPAAGKVLGALGEGADLAELNLTMADKASLIGNGLAYAGTLGSAPNVFTEE